MFIATFAFLNAPFAASKVVPDRRPAVGPTEKKGQEYNPEPVPRPQSTPQSTPPRDPAPPQKKN